MSITAYARPATERQIAYVRSLAEQLNLAPGDVDAAVYETALNALASVDSSDPKFISFAEASAAIDALKPLVRAKRLAQQPVTMSVTLAEQLAQINPGRYALPRKKDGVIDCFEVVERKDGKRYLNQLLGGNVAGTKFRRKYLPVNLQAAAARAILADQKASAELYADTYAECPRCHVALTHPRSRAAKIGKACAAEWGWTW